MGALRKRHDMLHIECAYEQALAHSLTDLPHLNSAPIITGSPSRFSCVMMIPLALKIHRPRQAATEQGNLVKSIIFM